MTPEGIGGGFGEPPKDVGGKENFSVPEDVGRQDDKEVVNSGVESGEKSEEVLVGDKTEALAGEAPTSSKEGDLEPAKDGTVGIEKEVSSEEETEVLTGEVFTPGKDGSLEPVSKNGSVIDFSKKEPVVKEEGESAPKHGDVVFEDKEEYPEDTEEKPESVLINEIKEAVKAYHILDMDEGEDRNEAAKQVLKVAKISGVGDLENLLAARNNKNVSQEGISRKVDQLGIAISKAIEEVGSPEMKQAIEAGSFSTEKILPEAWKIVVEGDERDQSLARVIVDGAIESKVSNAARRDAISNEMESVDYYLNNPQYGLLEGQIEASIASLRAMQSPLRAKEMSFISGKIAYLQELKTNIGGKNIKDRDTIESEVVTEASAESHESKKGKSERTRKSEDVPEEAFRGRKSAEDGDDSVREGNTRSWELDLKHMADAIKLMAGDLRWSDWTPPEWFKKLEEDDPEKAYRISLMVMMNEAAAGLRYAGKDLDKILGSRSAFVFKGRHMSKLFNEDFKLVTSRMLNDLCEFYTDENGKHTLRYKEEDVVDEKGKIIKRTIKKDVRDKLSTIEDYEDNLALWLAKYNGRTEANEMDKLNAYTAWNMFFAFGDSSMADRMRILPTWEGIVADALRTLNPEYKAVGKWQVLKGGEAKTDKELVGAEYFSSLADHLLEIMKIERDLGHALVDGDETLRQKLINGKVSFLSHRTFYGFFDFVNGGRDLRQGSDPKKGEKFYDSDNNKGNNERISLAELVMGYVCDENGNERSKNSPKREFTFGDNQVTFMNEFRDSLEGAIMAYNCFTGNVKIDDPKKWIITLKSKLGMVSALTFSDVPAFTYARDPAFWRDILACAVGVDKRRISSDYVAINRVKTSFIENNKMDPEKVSYNMNLLDFIVNDLRIGNGDININELLRLLGVQIPFGKDPAKVSGINDTFEFKERIRTANLLAKRNRSIEYDEVVDINPRKNREFREMIKSVGALNSNNPEFSRLKVNFDRLVRSRSYENAKNVYNEILKLFRRTS
jgi:hypothetical protein